MQGKRAQRRTPFLRRLVIAFRATALYLRADEHALRGRYEAALGCLQAQDALLDEGAPSERHALTSTLLRARVCAKLGRWEQAAWAANVAYLKLDSRFARWWLNESERVYLKYYLQRLMSEDPSPWTIRQALGDQIFFAQLDLHKVRTRVLQAYPVWMPDGTSSAALRRKPEPRRLKLSG